jgi:hypothetical protein
MKNLFYKLKQSDLIQFSVAMLYAVAVVLGSYYAITGLMILFRLAVQRN